MSARTAARAGGRRENTFLALGRIPVVRRLWIAITLSSFGDWLGLLATTALAQQLTKHASDPAQGAAIGGVFLVRLSPDLVFGPIAAALADKLDRRKLAIVGDLAAGLLYASIAIGYNLVWLYVAQFLVEAVGLFTQPAKQVIQTTVVPKPLLATANQVSLFSVYGAALPAAGVFALLSAADRLAAGHGDVDVAIVIALLLNAVSFVVSSATVFVSRRQIPAAASAQERGKSVLTLLREGVGFVRGQRVVKALYFGIIGAFAAGGLTAGVARLWVKTLSAGDAGYAIMFGAVFTGLALGMLVGPKVLPGYTRSRVFALAIASAGASLLVMSLLRDFILAVFLTVVMGLFAGMAWIIGYTMIGHEVEDRLRGRVFAFVLSSARLTLLLTIAVGPILAGALGDHSIPFGSGTRLRFSGPGLTLLLGGVVALAVGGYALRRATPTRTTVRTLVRRRLLRTGVRTLEERTGLLVTVDGADPAATAATAAEVAGLLRERGTEVVLAEPTAAPTAGAEPETGALLTAAARSEQVAKVIRPALERGAVVVCDQFVLTSMALYGGGLGADVDHIRDADLWASGDLRADLTIVLTGTPVPDDMDAAAVEAVLQDAADADRDHHVLVAPGDLLDEVRTRLDRLVTVRHGALSTAELSAVENVLGAGVAGVEVAEVVEPPAAPTAGTERPTDHPPVPHSPVPHSPVPHPPATEPPVAPPAPR